MTSTVVLSASFNKLENLVMPGKLIDGHARYESDCENCHERFDRKRQNHLCLKCHKKVAEDVNAQEGFHGTIRDVKEARACSTCHTDHKGRTAQVVLFDDELFNHKRADFELRGNHVKVKCDACHLKEKKFRDASSQCFGCHEKDDVHGKKMGEKCQSCHTEFDWREARFDHEKTDFKLKDGHSNLVCDICHPNERYKKTPKACSVCHEFDDVHNGDYANKCQDCHAEKSWALLKFDHDKDTKYKLEGPHANVICGDCHEGNVYKENLKSTCITCHKNRDVHNKRYGQKCQSCHVVKSWRKNNYDHDKTDYPLKGEHKEVACDDCHAGDIYKEELKTDCFSCHVMDDVHQGQEGKKCHTCHNEKGWNTSASFDHGLGKFPLLGFHVIAPCESCHLTSTYKDTEINCSSCHTNDDIHKEKLGPKCGVCHGPYKWMAWQFDHDKQSDFPLKGKHKGIDCLLCHKDPVKKEFDLPGDCYFCHDKDDNHEGKLGKKCDLCHSETSFKDVKLNQ